MRQLEALCVAGGCYASSITSTRRRSLLYAIPDVYASVKSSMRLLNLLRITARYYASLITTMRHRKHLRAIRSCYASPDSPSRQSGGPCLAWNLYASGRPSRRESPFYGVLPKGTEESEPSQAAKIVFDDERVHWRAAGLVGRARHVLAFASEARALEVLREVALRLRASVPDRQAGRGRRGGRSPNGSA